MPLVERYDDWNITDGSFADPHRLEFDHRIEADVANSKTGLANVEDNVKATCIITILKPEFGWTHVGSNWLYDPSHKGTDLHSRWRNQLSDCVQHDRDSLRDCFCNAIANPNTAYVGPGAGALPTKIDSLEWPSDRTEFVSRFALSGQYVIGPLYSSAYHLGNGYVGTAGHCLDRPLKNQKLGDLRVVFNWVGDVVSKSVFSESEVFEIEKVFLCDSHGDPPSPMDLDATARWTRRWDTTILKMKGEAAHFSCLKTATFATRPPAFGTPVYNIGGPLGNSGGPVFDASTGLIVGHTSSTNDAVSESDESAIGSWARIFSRSSKNYALCAEINTLLEKQEPDNELYRVHPKFLRTLLGKPRDSTLIKCATNVCPGDLGPNRRLQAPDRYQAVFSRHCFDCKDLYLRNVTARVDRSAIFMTPLNVLLSDYNGCLLTIKCAGNTETFREPDARSALIITIGLTDWKLLNLNFHRVTSYSIRPELDVWSITVDLTTRLADIPQSCLKAPRGLIDWTKVRLEQPLHNPPHMVGLNFSIRRPSFHFPVNRDWPSGRSDVTNNPADVSLKWPEETFEFATTTGETCSIPQTGDSWKSATEGKSGPELWTWEAPLDRLWTNPRQPSLQDQVMDNVDEALA